MSDRKRYKAVFQVNDENVMEITDKNKDTIVARAMGLIESAHTNAICTVYDIETEAIVQTIKRSSIE